MKKIASIRLCAGAAAALAVLGCQSDQGISEIEFEYVAVTTGDFDEMEEMLARNEVPSDLYEGYIFAPVYDEERDPDSIAYKAEELFKGVDENDDPLLFRYPAVFVNSGTRGLGEYVYNGVESDDSLVSDDEVIQRVQEYLDRKRVLVVSDWAYDLVEAAFPDEIGFLNEDDGYDAAQVGSDEPVIADVVDPDLAETLEGDTLVVDFDFSYGAVIEDVASSTDVHLRGDMIYRAGDGEGYDTIEDVPLLVSFDTSGGRVIFSSFSWRAQNAWVTDQILGHLIEGLDVEEDGGSE